ncbi:MAG TPA: HD domain-containing protein [Saprospiraceae bacterium]|nr:HD domain-containing protein [Saprospiraceae bacterium]
MFSNHPLNTARDVDEIVEAVMSLFRFHGHAEYHGEAVSQFEHAVQAALLAKNLRPDDPEFVLAAFLHDIGHLCVSEGKIVQMGSYGVADHETLGARYLMARGFSARIARLVAAHVEAKRYLVATDPVYFAGLSEASRQTLALQGGPMSPDEIAAFRQDSLLEEHLMLRRIDDQAKIPGQSVQDIFWLEMLIRKHLLQRL